MRGTLYTWRHTGRLTISHNRCNMSFRNRMRNTLVAIPEATLCFPHVRRRWVHRCTWRGAAFMALASWGELKLGAWWFDFWRGMVAFPNNSGDPNWGPSCPKHGNHCIFG